MAVENWSVRDDEAGRRLDAFVTEKLAQVGRRKVQQLIDDGCVQLNGRVARRKATLLAPGDFVELLAAPTWHDFAASADAAMVINVLYEDAQLVVVDKPAGVATQPLRSDELGTIANGLLVRYPEMAAVGYSRREPGILHRLDRQTSGVVLAARDAATFAVLRSDLQSARLDKRYQALCQGELAAPASIDLPIAEDPHNARRVRALGSDAPRQPRRAQEAFTEILKADSYGDWSLLGIRLLRGRRHQIRAHLAAIGHPLYGDTLYGGHADAQLGRHFLHADAIELRHPHSGRPLRVEAPLPEDLAALLGRLRRSS